MMQYQFKPSLFMTLLTILLLIVFIMLGFWQLDRSEQKYELKKQFLENQKHILTTLAFKADSLPKKQYRTLMISGKFVNQQQFLLDNKIFKGRVGYDVITPFIPNKGDKILLVNRGWIAQGKSRSSLPKIKPITGEIQLKGMIKIPSKKTFVLSNKVQAQAAMWPKRIQKIDVTKIQALLSKPVYPYILLLAPEQPYGFIRDWKPINMRPEKHIGYAVQWFAFAFVLLIIYFAVNIRKKDKEKK